MILQTMLERLYQSLLKGPGLNARPYRSRQRLDVMDLVTLGSGRVESLVRDLLGDRRVELPAMAPRVSIADGSPQSDEERMKREAWDKQCRLLRKLSAIAADAKEYGDDHGENALFIGYPVLSLPKADGAAGSSRVLAPLAMIPVHLGVRTDGRPGVTIAAAEEGADRVVANPALLAWIEKMTGESSEELFADDEGGEAWRELQEIFDYVTKSLAVAAVLDPQAPLVPVPATRELPDGPVILNSAVLGLFPLTNPGLIRDTQSMLEGVTPLAGPVAAFLSPRAIEPPVEKPLPEAEAHAVEQQAAHQRDFDAERLITRADPCQAAAVAAAAKVEALVVHGPPGTGKSQTIANIIGEHLARGERVLFVCDKRTALDVVKFRLDALGIGHLCGVIHDPQRDRRDFYMTLRQRLEDLVEATMPRNPEPAIKLVNERLTALHGELRDAYAALHAPQADGESFHDWVGRWIDLQDVPAQVPEADRVTLDLLERHRTDVEEACRRSLAAGLADNVLVDGLAMDVDGYLRAPAGEPEDRLLRVAAALELPGDGEVLPTLGDGDLEVLASAREEISRLIGVMGDALAGEQARVVLTSSSMDVHVRDWSVLAETRRQLKAGFDRELSLQVKDRPLVLTEINRTLVALVNYRKVMKRWTRWFAFRKRRAATEALANFGLPLDEAALDRAIAFHEGLKARVILGDHLKRTFGIAEPRDDSEWSALLDRLEPLFALASLLHGDAVLECEGLRHQLTTHVGDAADRLARSAARARALRSALELASRQGLLRDERLRDWEQWCRDGRSGRELAARIRQAVTTLEEVLRLQAALAALPAEMRAAVRGLVAQACPPEVALAALTRAALDNRIRALLAERATLGRIDTQRIESAFKELGERIEEKQALVQKLVVRNWRQRQSQRLLAGTGSRLGPAGSALRQRLYVRGKKALRLRQMIAAGDGHDGGDPLFDLCPVWMASPNTVAQIFPRQALFDLVVFDEASQCRLEEALPVLLRAKRLVVAGDPKQLPPTRFFESAMIESDEEADEEDLHARQMSEMEDLLGASLNLDFHQAFLDVHYRSRHAALIGYSNLAFYGSRLQPIPGAPVQGPPPIRLLRVDGDYRDQTNPAEAAAAVALVAELLDQEKPPSVGIATFNLKQRNLILEQLDDKAAADADFARRLETARQRQGKDSFEGLFVKNLENVQGDERDVMIISTTFGRAEDGRFRRNFGALSQSGGERRLNVLVTRARSAIHILTSIPREEYTASHDGSAPNGRLHLYQYLAFAERLVADDEARQDAPVGRSSAAVRCVVRDAREPSPVATALGQRLAREGCATTVHWGNDGFCVDVAVETPGAPTFGLLTDFNRYRNTPDPIQWEWFRSQILRAQGWRLERLWSPRLHRDLKGEVAKGMELRMDADGRG